MKKKRYIAPAMMLVALDEETQFCATVSSMPVGGTSKEFDAPSRRSSGWEDYEQ